jgi:hypothetical protein
MGNGGAVAAKTFTHRRKAKAKADVGKIHRDLTREGSLLRSTRST